MFKLFYIIDYTKMLNNRSGFFLNLRLEKFKYAEHAKH